MSETTWFVKINGGDEIAVTTASSLYDFGVAAALATVGDPDDKDAVLVEIWSPRLLPDYGPYFYAAQNDKFGNLTIVSVQRESALKHLDDIRHAKSLLEGK